MLEDLCAFINRDDISPLPQGGDRSMPSSSSSIRSAMATAASAAAWFTPSSGAAGLAPHYAPPISLVLGANKDAYISGLREFRTGKTDLWVAYFARAVEIAAVSARDFSAEVAALQSDWRALLGPVRSDAAALPLIDLLPKFPVITAAVAEREIGRSRPATINALSRLHEVGALKRHRNQKKGDSWEAKELFDLLGWFERRRGRAAQAAARWPK